MPLQPRKTMVYSSNTQTYLVKRCYVLFPSFLGVAIYIGEPHHALFQVQGRGLESLLFAVGIGNKQPTSTYQYHICWFYVYQNLSIT